MLRLLFLTAVSLLPSLASEAKPGKERLAVLDFRNTTDGELAEREVQYITKLVRGATRQSLPTST